MNIAVCDDSVIELELTKVLLNEYETTHPGKTIHVDFFEDGTKLLSAMDSETEYDIYLLDIIMPHMNGIDVGKQLRSQNHKGSIIYLSGTKDFALDAFDVQATNYLLKPIQKDKLFSILDTIFEQSSSHAASTISVRTGDGIFMVPLQKLMSAELSNRCVVYTLSDGSTMTSTSLRHSFKKEMEPLLQNANLIQCAASFAINLKYVTAIENNHLVLVNKRAIPISRKLYTSIKKQWLSQVK